MAWYVLPEHTKGCSHLLKELLRVCVRQSWAWNSIIQQHWKDIPLHSRTKISQVVVIINIMNLNCKIKWLSYKDTNCWVYHFSLDRFTTDQSMVLLETADIASCKKKQSPRILHEIGIHKWNQQNISKCSLTPSAWYLCKRAICRSSCE